MESSNEIEVPGNWKDRGFNSKFVIAPGMDDGDIAMGTVSLLDFEVGCQFCGNTFQSHITTRFGEIVPTYGQAVEKVVKRAVDNGWRELDSEEFAQKGTACPSCVLREMKHRLDIEAAYQKGKTNE